MYYPIAIEWGDENTATGIVFPDIPGAISAGDTPEDAYDNAVEAAHIVLQERAARGQPLPKPGRVDEHRRNPDFAGWGWGMIDIDLTPYLGKAEKVTVTLPGKVLRQIDEYVTLHGIKSRSTFLNNAALEKLHHR
ncbi:MAG: type II toxin-antitoxin system HicB family antitoxin [Pseudomonadota bacterium]